MSRARDPAPSPAPTPASVLDSRSSWLRLLVSVLAGTVGSVGIWAVILVLPQVEAEFGADRADAALAYTATMLGFALGNLLGGRLVDRFGIAPTLFVAGLLQAAGFALAAIAPGLVVFVAAQGVMIGIGSAAGFGPVIADISRWFLRRRGIAVAAAASGNYLAGAVWPLILKAPIQSAGWRDVYLGVALTLAVALPVLALLLRRRLPAGVDAAAAAATGYRRAEITLTPRQLQGVLALAGLACCVAMSMPQVHIVAFCADLGYGPAVGAEMLSLMLAGGVVSRLASGALADRLGGVRTLLIGSALQGIALILYLPFDGLTSLYVVSLIFGLSQGGIVPSYALIVREYLPAAEAGRRVGAVLMATVLGMALGGWMSGWVYDQTGSYTAAFLNGIAWNALNLMLALFVLARSRRVAGGLPA